MLVFGVHRPAFFLPEGGYVTRSTDNGTPFFENRFLFETVLDDFSF